MTANNIISFDENILTSVEVYDTSTYDTNNSVVTATRFMFATVNSINNKTSVTKLKAWTEYTADTAITLNYLNYSYTYAIGDIIYLPVDYTLASGQSATETGFYGEHQTWLPSSGDYNSFSFEQTGNTSDNPVFTDNVFTLKYELFTTEYGNSSTPPQGTYIVNGGSNAYFLTFDIVNKNYGLSGQVIPLNGSSQITCFNGATVSKLESSCTTYFATTGQALQTLQTYIEALANNQNSPQEVKSNLLKIIANYNVVDFAAEQEYNFDLQYMQDLLDEIQEYYNIINPNT
jgi:hypothetical protein